MAVVVGTWAFSNQAVRVIADELLKGRNSLDALEKGINDVEDDPLTGRYVVGRGGYPNSEGVVECDSAVMLGDHCQFGAVAALQGVATPFSVARLVLERSPHSMLVGSGARTFAEQNGVKIESEESLQTQESKDAYKKHQGQKLAKEGHDTLGVLVLDSKSQLLAGVSSSGKPFKSPGRVGDSPLPGSGLFADNETGAAVASGDGDFLLRFCPSYQAVQLMSQGYTPQEACEQVVRVSQTKAGTLSEPFEMAVLAIDKVGRVGAASTVEFPYTVWRQQDDTLETKISSFKL
ncbi:N(4)-(Beta-N-acetylglucosaminyl)-L-asparaginase [Nematostella vectensis]|uniref:N(4)-(Beta-N-acetylglucosaminyl)-L-asparaginase n=1 Tax=Nematostella vectensis TaxID=45351 RepID=UPI002076D634|nr:N(4)-(Beta-N-acetylglucosaminyl)-L-asparaginase [Nematostella vectensis]